jgi:hypothetical protein
MSEAPKAIKVGSIVRTLKNKHGIDANYIARVDAFYDGGVLFSGLSGTWAFDDVELIDQKISVGDFVKGNQQVRGMGQVVDILTQFRVKYDDGTMRIENAVALVSDEESIAHITKRRNELNKKAMELMQESMLLAEKLAAKQSAATKEAAKEAAKEK